jgi:hypothetical protein
MNHCRLLKRALLLFIVFFVVTLIRLADAEQTDERWKVYLEYFDPTRKAVFLCFYEYQRILSSPDSPTTVLVWERIVPRDRYFENWGDLKWKRLIDTTSLYEIDCRETKFRTLEEYSHYEDVTGYATTPSSWQDIAPGSRQEHLAERVCRAP